MEQEESISIKKMKREENASIKKMGREDRILLICKIISSIFAIVGIIFIWMMVSDFIEFASFIDNLKQIYPSYIFNDPQVQSAITQGYLELAQMPLTVAIPMFILAIIVYGAGKKVVNRIPIE
ncbi:MAG: hypothetical protein KAX18_02950 [Candidatus Lokiarchaeota archaeon]|nr:hypothetical protein [Candidatus Lokiarchaeota archaeon]